MTTEKISNVGQRRRVLNLLHEAIYQLQTDEEYSIDYLSTILHGLEKEAKHGETVSQFAKRTRAAIADWQRAQQQSCDGADQGCECAAPICEECGEEFCEKCGALLADHREG